MKDKIIIDGEEYTKSNSIEKVERLSFDDIHIIIHRKDIEIKGKLCFYCGEIFEKDALKNLTKHHGIKKSLKAEYNVMIPVCLKCHRKKVK